MLRVLNSYFSMRTAAVFVSERITRPVATNCSGQMPPSFAGQFTLTSTRRPTGSVSSVVNRIPPLPIFSELPQPLSLAVLD